MSPRMLGDIKNSDVIARRADLAVTREAVLDNAKHAEGEVINRGEVLAKDQSSGKYRAYAEGKVTTAFATNSAAFAVDPDERAAKNFKVGDVIEDMSANLLGTIETFDAETGEGTLEANSAAALAANGSNRCRLKKADYALDGGDGLILQDEVIMEDLDKPVSGYAEGFFVKSRTSLTASAITEMGGTEPTSDEVRIG